MSTIKLPRSVLLAPGRLSGQTVFGSESHRQHDHHHIHRRSPRPPDRETGAVPGSSRNSSRERPGDVKKRPDGWSIELAGQWRDSAVGAGSEIGLENTLNVETAPNPVNYDENSQVTSVITGSARQRRV
jgi:hypothetical protein